MGENGKPKFAMYWAAGCGGCEIGVLDIQEALLDVADFFEIVFWPVAIDVKYKDVEAFEDDYIDLCLFNGGIRSDENKHLAELLRAKSKTLVAFGSCAHEGCIPGLGNQYSKEGIMDYAFGESPSTENPENHRPQTHYTMPEGDVEIPAMLDVLTPLDAVVDVDYYIPGCPPQAPQILEVMQAIMSGAELPPKGSVIGAGTKTVCDECPRERKEKKIKEFKRPGTAQPEPEECLLDQGFICLGPATRSGCGGLCVKANSPCRGCYGAPPNVEDQGAKMLSALSSVIDSSDPEEIEKIIGSLDDPLGTFYRFSLAKSSLRRLAK
ncbi:MAG: oxidoreductase [Armatimonadia bacterium]|jgi:F420-non-reducing hydrogenase small subunit|nr:oxidoreductase [Armatimonadia bacterium]